MTHEQIKKRIAELINNPLIRRSANWEELTQQEIYDNLIRTTDILCEILEHLKGATSPYEEDPIRSTTFKNPMPFGD